MATDMTVTEAAIPGFYIIDVPLFGDNRGWFKENYQKTKLVALGLPPFEIVQNNISFNAEKGVTRGIHAEPWEKYITSATGRVFGAWVDLRQGDSFGTIVTLEITPGKAVFVPRGVGNSFQTLEPNVAYSYLVNEHWSANADYTHVNLFDPEIGIQWPISKQHAIVSQKDTKQPMLADVIPMEV